MAIATSLIPLQVYNKIRSATSSLTRKKSSDETESINL